MKKPSVTAYVTCLYPGCTRWLAGRGLCQHHYNAARRFVREGRTTWAKLEATGKTKPAKTRLNAWFLEK